MQGCARTPAAQLERFKGGLSIWAACGGDTSHLIIHKQVYLRFWLLQPGRSWQPGTVVATGGQETGQLLSEDDIFEQAVIEQQNALD